MDEESTRPDTDNTEVKKTKAKDKKEDAKKDNKNDKKE